MTYMASFGQLISARRKQVGLSQKQLAGQITKEDGEPISPQYLNDIERNRRNPPSESLIDQFATVLGISKDHLCFAAGTMPSDLRKLRSTAEPEKVEAAFRAFRKVFRGK